MPDDLRRGSGLASVVVGPVVEAVRQAVSEAMGHCPADNARHPAGRAGGGGNQPQR